MTRTAVNFDLVMGKKSSEIGPVLIEVSIPLALAF